MPCVLLLISLIDLSYTREEKERERENDALLFYYKEKHGAEVFFLTTVIWRMESTTWTGQRQGPYRRTVGRTTVFRKKKRNKEMLYISLLSVMFLF